MSIHVVSAHLGKGEVYSYAGKTREHQRQVGKAMVSGILFPELKLHLDEYMPHRARENRLFRYMTSTWLPFACRSVSENETTELPEFLKGILPGAEVIEDVVGYRVTAGGERPTSFVIGGVRLHVRPRRHVALDVYEELDAGHKPLADSYPRCLIIWSNTAQFIEHSKPLVNLSLDQVSFTRSAALP